MVHNNKLVLSVPPIVFKLTAGYRMPELFEYEDALFALMTKNGDYRLVKLDPNNRAFHEVFQFSKTATKYKQEGYDTNFEGAAVHPKTKELWLTADNEKFENASNSKTPPRREEKSRGKTPLVVFPVEIK